MAKPRRPVDKDTREGDRVIATKEWGDNYGKRGRFVSHHALDGQCYVIFDNEDQPVKVRKWELEMLEYE